MSGEYKCYGVNMHWQMLKYLAKSPIGHEHDSIGKEKKKEKNSIN